MFEKAFSSSVSISLNILSINFPANTGTLSDPSDGLFVTPWSMPAGMVGGATAEKARAGLLFSHVAYLVALSVAFVIASALSFLPCPLRLLSESFFRLVPS